ncbi:hypothetical protein C0995_000279 [Termitomyces sp. Mi166|nr:hypothetical protein C0995_000279 [Termitomyces sp. Mi166\
MSCQGNSGAAVHFQPHEMKASRGLLRRLLTSSDDLMGELRQMAGEIIMSVAYRIKVDSKDDPYITIAEEGVDGIKTAAIPGAFLVESIPILKHVPDWMPFAGFKRKAKHWRKITLDMVNKPYEVAKRSIERGDATPSLTSSSLQNMDQSSDLKLQEDVIKWTAGTVYAAGSDTTVAAIASCILGLLTNPAALKKAQEEIDHVIGPNQLPTFDDEGSLPDWVAIPHLLNVNDEYNGYWLPKGSLIIPNAW